MLERKARIAAIISGGGTNLQAVLDAQGRVLHSGMVTLVVSNRKAAYGLERARAAGIETAVLSKAMEPDPALHDEKLLKLLQSHDIDVVLLAGYLGILGPKVLNAYEGRVVNIHPALIPAFCGLGMYGLKVHEAALARGVKLTGATAHLVNGEVDGGPILLQKAVEVKVDDTPEVLQRRVMEEAEWILLPRAAEMVCNQAINIQERAVMMNIQTLPQAVSATSYPGRGIMVGLHRDAAMAVIAYFIMGRSANSRNRVFVEDGEGIRTQAHDPALMKDPSLVIYAPVRVLGDTTICTNGDQTDTIHKFMSEGKGPCDALHTREFEPDGPNWTPRISAVAKVAGGTLQYQLSILKSADGDGRSCERFFYDYAQPVAGVGHFIHTYKCDGDPIPSFEGEPEKVIVDGTIDEITEAIWRNLHEDNKVSLFVRTIGLKDGAVATRIVNKNG